MCCQSLGQTFLAVFQHLNINELSLTVTYSRSDLQFLHLSLRSPLARLSHRFYSELDISLMLSINFILHVIALPFPFFFLLV